MLRANEIAVRFGGVAAVGGVSLELGAGEFVGLIGPNGSGKSTFLNALCGMVRASGRLTVDDEQVPLGRPRRSRAAGILRVFQNPQTYVNLSCLENVLLATDDRQWSGLSGSWLGRRSMWRRERLRWVAAHEALERVGLAALAGESASLLPYGHQRLLELARALAAQPKVLFLDEPSAGLNDAETSNLADLLAELHDERLAILMVDHKIEFVDRLCRRVVVLELGQCIADGPAEAVWSDPKVVSAYVGAE